MRNMKEGVSNNTTRMSNSESLDVELELISASLLPAEELTADAGPSWPRVITVANADSRRALHIQVGDAYPSRDAVNIELKGNDIGRDEATRQNAMIAETQAGNWEADDEYVVSFTAHADRSYPLYQLLTASLLPLIAPTDAAPPDPQPDEDKAPPISHHTLLTSHHLLSPTKRKNLLALASQLSLTGFSKVGHPGIYYAIGEREDLEEWTREVKSWNWLALRVRVSVEPVPGAEEELQGSGRESGARGGKGRGDWVELEKIGEALEWLRKRGREKMLLDTGIGGGGD